MISKATSKFINSLQLKKYRQEYRKFIVEGKKNIEELLASDFYVDQLFLTDHAKAEVQDLLHHVNYEVATQLQIEKISSLKSNNFGVAVVDFPDSKKVEGLNDQFVVALDHVQDPGNLGTIIRACDWYGIKNIICSRDTVDCYSNKVVASTMGGIFRVNIQYVDLEDFFSKTDLPIYGAILGGDDLHQVKEIKPGVLLMGNESKGVSDTLRKYCTQQFEIPKIGEAESLNVAMATTIFLDNFCRISKS